MFPHLMWAVRGQFDARNAIIEVEALAVNLASGGFPPAPETILQIYCSFTRRASPPEPLGGVSHD